MIGRPRRRHLIDHTGRLQQRAHQGQPVASHPTPKHPAARPARPIDQRRLKTPWLKVGFLTIAGVIAVLLLWIGIGSLLAYSKVTDKNQTKKAPVLNFLGEIRPNQLQGEGDGRVNVLLIGVGGKRHPGGTLADTIMVASLDPKNKEVALLSIPRDLWVPISGNGYGKINSAHSYGEKEAKKTGGGPLVLKKTVSQILDLPIHYYIRVDFEALEDIVDALGGVTVEVEKPIVDLSYPADNMIDFSPFRLNAGSQTINGKTALRYARSRHAAGSEGSDFSRARRQQKLLAAIKDKALSVGVLGNPKKITQLIGILGDHVKTDITLPEIERFMQIWKEIDNSKILTKVLDNGVDGPLISQSGDGRGYILLPRTGDFSEVQEIAHSVFIDPYLRQEKASISFVNSSGSAATGKSVIRQLTSYGYTVTDNTPKDPVKASKTQLTDLSGKKPFTKQFLESRFKVKATTKINKTQSYDLVLNLGSDYQLPKLKSVATVKPSPSPSLSSSPLKFSSPSATPPNESQ